MTTAELKWEIVKRLDGLTEEQLKQVLDFIRKALLKQEQNTQKI